MAGDEQPKGAVAQDGDGQDDENQDNAAKTIQRNYRGYRGRREMKGCGISAADRWKELLKDAQYYQMVTPRSKTAGDDFHGTKRRWSRLTGITARAHDGGKDDEEPADRDDAFEYYVKKLRAEKREGEHSKTMGLEYWLELVDRKHRYGTNLLKYHAIWRESDTDENFFYWLDEGDGKDQDLEACSREKLESQQLQYLTREERFPYLIDIDEHGLLRWAKNNEKVTTHAPADKDDKEPNANEANTGADGQTETTNHVTDDLHNMRGILQGAGHAVPTPLAALIERNQDKASWIFVVDTSFRIYAGIKASGGFQHSSFLHGSRVLSAGLISIQDGKLQSLSPHSGHYRPTAENFWLTAKSLEAKGVDISELSISGSWGMLRMAEVYRDGLGWIKEMWEAGGGDGEEDEGEKGSSKKKKGFEDKDESEKAE